MSTTEAPEGNVPINVEDAGRTLADHSADMADRYRCLYFLRGGDNDQCVEIIGRAMLPETDALLKHDEAYVLGQMARVSAIPFLIDVLTNLNDAPMVRHEAGEALGAIGSPEPRVVETLTRFVDDPNPVVAETCILAIRRIGWINDKSRGDDGSHTFSPYNSIDPTPISDEIDVPKLGNILVNDGNNHELWERYRAMFSLRNINTDDSALALARGLRCDDSALLRHEVAYVLGQLKNPVTVPHLADGLRDLKEQGMVRHECAEALGAIATPEAQSVLKEFLNDEVDVVRTSCVVALDMAEYENSGDFQYARSN